MSNEIKFFSPAESIQNMEIKVADKFMNLCKQNNNPYTKEPLMPNMDFVTNRNFTGLNDINLLLSATEMNVKSLMGTYGANLEICGFEITDKANPTPVFANMNNQTSKDIFNYQNRSDMLHEGAKIDGQLFYFYDHLTERSQKQLLENRLNSTKSYIQLRGDEQTQKKAELLTKKMAINVADYNNIHSKPQFKTKIQNYKENLNNPKILNEIKAERNKILSTFNNKDENINLATKYLFKAVEEYKKCQITNKKSKFLIENQENINKACEILIENVEKGKIQKNVFSKIILQANEFAERVMTKDFSYNIQHNIAQNQHIINQIKENSLAITMPDKNIQKARNNPQKWLRETR